METILVHKNGNMTRKGRPVTGSVLKLLGSVIRLKKDVTLGSFFKMVRTYPDLLNLSDVLETLADIALKPDAAPSATGEIESLVFYKTIEIKGFPGKPALTVYNSLKGVCNQKYMDLKFFHLESLLNHTMHLGRLEHIVFGDKEDVFSYDTFYTLFEFIEGIAWGLSFNFNPLECSIRR